MDTAPLGQRGIAHTDDGTFVHQHPDVVIDRFNELDSAIDKLLG